MARPKLRDYYKASDGKYVVLDNAYYNTWRRVDTKPTQGREFKSDLKTLVDNPNDPDSEPIELATYKIGPSDTEALKATTLRYPNIRNLTIGKVTDYVLFEFGKYQPPFASENDPTGAGLAAYNRSAISFKPIDGSSIILQMPQDLSTESRHDWAGKSFSSLGRAAVAALGAGDFSRAAQLKNNDMFNAFANAISAAGINQIPGVGGNVTMNDISGSSRGVILNPNAEVLYEAPLLRELGMVFKMFPRNKPEAEMILKICQTFRRMSSPSYGTEDTDSKVKNFVKGSDGEDITQKGVNYIHVPKLCRFHFMTGAGVNKKLAQYKPCAITRVQVNYTPDGTYATYSDGSPVAIELQLGFMETKLIFSNEISDTGGESF
jgi:hypothetical protein